MPAIFGPGGPIILPWTVRGDRFSGGTVHGVTVRLTHANTDTVAPIKARLAVKAVLVIPNSPVTHQAWVLTG